MSKALAELFKHNLWANLRLLDSCEKVEETHLDANTAGTYGRVRDTLVHIFAAEERYVFLLTGRLAERPLRESEGYPGIEELRSRARNSGGSLVEVAESARPTKILRGVRPASGQPFVLPIMIVLTQAINHATEHRAQIAVILTQAGIEPPDFSSWAWGEATGQI
jgi:uncharacterized damage-inducible protein DinB